MTTPCDTEMRIDRESLEPITVPITGPGDMTAMVWQYALVAEGTTGRVWVSAVTLPSGLQINLPGTQLPGRYTLYVRGVGGAPTLAVPGSVLIT